MSNLPFQRIGRYEVIRLLGTGGMGAVYEVRAAGSDERLALKLLAMPEQDLAERFRREARTLELLSKHEHMVGFREAGEERGRLYIVMDLLPGGSLEDKVRAGPLSEPDAIAILIRLARAVHFIHELGVVHRDLKPQNILFDAQGRPRITDLGLAKSRRELQSLTATGAVLGTIHYMAPEQANEAGSVDRRTDIWALGAILHRLVTGRTPFEGAETSVLKSILFETAPSIRSRRPELSPGLDAICAKALERIPGRRYATAEQLAQDLDRLVEGKPPVWATPPAASRSRGLAFAAAGGILLVVVIGVLAAALAAKTDELARARVERPSQTPTPPPPGAVPPPGAARAKALVEQARRTGSVALVDEAFQNDPTTIYVDTDKEAREALGKILLQAAHVALVASGSPSVPDVALARSRLLRARVLLPRDVPTVEEGRALRTLWQEGHRGDLTFAIRPFVGTEVLIPQKLEAYEDHEKYDTAAFLDEQPQELFALQRALDTEHDKTPRVKRDAYLEALLFHPEVPAAWLHVLDEAVSCGDWALSVRSGFELVSFGKENEYYLYRKGDALRYLGRYREAAEALSDAWLRSGKRDGWCGLALACTYFALNDRAKLKAAIQDVWDGETAKGDEKIQIVFDALNVLRAREQFLEGK